MDARQDFYLAALAQCPGLGSRSASCYSQAWMP